MSAQLLDKIFREAQELSPQEQLKLAARLLERATAALPEDVAPRRQCAEIAGIAPYPLAGQDAQGSCLHEPGAAPVKAAPG